MKRFYITTTLPYVNAAPHIGHALEFVQADVIARYHRILGEDVFFNIGTDEHGLKVYKAALAEGKEPQAYVDEYAEKFRKFADALNISYDNFIRTTDAPHKKASQEFWRRCQENGDVYKGAYKIKYCVGCELEKTDSELVDGRCPLHPNLKIEIIEEENYFFRFSRYGEKLLKFYKKTPQFVMPESRFNEIKNFVKAGLKDFSISRLKEKMPWGVEVPGDPKQVMYVWFDALINYISTLGWPENEEKFRNFWGAKEAPNALQIAGKDQVRQQAAMWQAMLMSAGLPNSKQILIHGFITSSGEKMSKSLGNVIEPYEVIEKYGADALRYWLLREISTFEDGDFTWEKFRERYNADLANGLGNFASRVSTLAEKHGEIDRNVGIDIRIDSEIEIAEDLWQKNLEKFSFQDAIASIGNLISFGDKYLNENEAWKDYPTKTLVIFSLVSILDRVAGFLNPFLPDSAERISNSISQSDSLIKVKKIGNLFPRK